MIEILLHKIIRLAVYRSYATKGAAGNIGICHMAANGSTTGFCAAFGSGAILRMAPKKSPYIIFICAILSPFINYCKHIAGHLAFKKQGLTGSGMKKAQFFSV